MVPTSQWYIRVYTTRNHMDLFSQESAEFAAAKQTAITL